MRREVGHLILARSVYRTVIALQKAAARGDEAELRHGLDVLASGVLTAMPELEAILTAQAQTAQAFDLTERTLSRFVRREAQPHPHAVNDHVGTSEQPTQTIA